MGDVTIGLAFIAGFLSFISPCVLPLVPAYIGYMGARTTRNVVLETGGKAKLGVGESVGTRFQMLLHGAAFVLGFTIVFVLIGLMTTAFVSTVGSAVTILTDIIGRVGGVIIIFFGLHFMGVLPKFFAWARKRKAVLNNVIASIVIGLVFSSVIAWGFISPVIFIPVLVVFWALMLLGGGLTPNGNFWIKLMNTIEQGLYTDTRGDMQAGKAQGLGGSLMMGVVFSAGWTPCIGPLLGAILTVAANSGDVGVAVPMLTAYSLGLGIPFMLTAALLEGAQGILRRLQRHMRAIELASGALLVLIGILVATGSIQSLSANLSNQFADFSFRLEECGVGFFSGEVAGGQVGECVDGVLVPVAVGQGASAELTVDRPLMKYLFHAEANEAIDVELERLEGDISPIVTIVNAEGEEIARSEELTITAVKAFGNDIEDLEVIEGDIDLTQYESYEGVSITGFIIPAEGRYTVEVTLADLPTGEDEVNFRVKVVEAKERTETEVGDLSGVGSITAGAEASGPAIGLDVGNRAPDFDIVTLEGDTIALSDLQGQVVLLNFWGTWCGPCRREMPDFQSVYSDRAEDGFTIVALAVRGDTTEKVEEFRDEFSLTFTLAVDEGDVINDLYGIQSQPSSYIIDKDGIILERHFGIMVESQVNEILDEALS